VPRLLVDNDVLLKAAHWGLLDAIPSMINGHWEDIAALESLIHRTRRQDRKLFRAPVVADELLSRLDQMVAVPVGESTVIKRLQDVVGLDAGEIVLIAALCADESLVLLTGDKRALRALVAPELQDIADKVRGRIVCLEHLLEHVLERSGAAVLAAHIAPYRDLDAAARSIVPMPAYATEEGIRLGLTSYLNDLARETNGLVYSSRPP
jgi:hypothetical protein